MEDEGWGIKHGGRSAGYERRQGNNIFIVVQRQRQGRRILSAARIGQVKK